MKKTKNVKTPKESRENGKTSKENGKPGNVGIVKTSQSSLQRSFNEENATTRLMASSAPYPSIDEVESDSTRSLDAARTHVLEQMNYVSTLRTKDENPRATLGAMGLAARSVAELVNAKVSIYRAYRGK